MKGLLLKDYYTLMRQAKVFLALIVVFSLLPGYNMSSFAIMYAAFMPITALAYDERSKWDSLAATMPYSPSDIVLGKYILGYMSVGAAALLSLAAKLVIAAVQKSALPAEEFCSVLLIACVALVMLAVDLPFMFKIGVEKGRLVFFAIVAVMVATVMISSGYLDSGLGASVTMSQIILISIAVTVIANAVSIPASIRLYRSKAA